MKPYYKRILHGLNFLPGIVIIGVSILALNTSLSASKHTKQLHQIYEESIPADADGRVDILATKGLLKEKDYWMYWSVVMLGLSGFALVIMNADKLRRLQNANKQQEEALELMEKQLEEIQKSENDKDALQEQLHQAQKLEAVGRLAGGIAHDFNNILAAMNGYAEFLMDDLEPETAQRSFAVDILKAGKQARDLVDKILAFSRREHNEMQQMRLCESIDETLSMLKASLPKTVIVNAEISDKDYIINGNPTLVSQALMNLCVNAKDAMPSKKGTIMVSLSVADMEYFQDIDTADELPTTEDLPLVSIKDVSATHSQLSMGKLASNQEYLCLSVADDGSGMSRVIMENIFEPFFTTKPVGKGTGLGLAMVHGLMASHRGAMQINSIAGKGTRFDLLFPIMDEVTEEKEEQIVREDWQAIGHVLLVEDQPEVQEMMKTMLERIGFEVETCDDGEAALEILSEHSDYFTAVVTDQNMPKMTGVEMIEKVAVNHPEIPFILLTGYSIQDLSDLTQEQPSVKAVLKKPVDREKLKEAVQSASLERQFAA